MRATMATLATLMLASAAAAQAPAPPKPGPEHEFINKQAGTWDCVMKGAGGESKGVMKFKPILGGLWLESDYDGEFAGQKFTGRGLDSYDAGKQKYVSVWVDSMGTLPTHFEGTYDKAAKKLTMIAENSCGPDGKTPAKMKSVAHYKDDDHIDFTMAMIGADGKEMEMFVLSYTRRK